MKKIEFPSDDGLIITADLYNTDSPKDFMVLCHRSHCNRAEYRETAPKFNRMGYSCLAIDQRSGMKIFGEINETKNRAKEKKLPTGFLDAKVDVEASVKYAYQLNNEKPIILLGSSYSASLALLIAAQTDQVKSVIAFSPGEYLKGLNVAEAISKLNKPVYVTSPVNEIEQVNQVMRNVNPQLVTHFKPKEEGFHGSKILWESVKGFGEHWKEIEKFLK